jgi:hypothetical protein
MLRWDRYGFHTKLAEKRYVELVFLHRVGSLGQVVHSSASGAQNVDTLFLLLGWSRCGFHTNCSGIRDAKLVLLHPVASAGHVVHSGASGAWNINALFFKLMWARNCIGTRYTKLVF